MLTFKEWLKLNRSIKEYFNRYSFVPALWCFSHLHFEQHPVLNRLTYLKGIHCIGFNHACKPKNARLKALRKLTPYFACQRDI
jgi:hypothetical protein